MYQAKIDTDQTLLSQIIDLRYEVLRKPWNKSRETVTDELESESTNAYISQDGMMVACGRLQNNGAGIGQIRYMAVHPDWQGKGLGKLIVQLLEEEARKSQLHTIELQARENAVEFYKALGYLIKEKSFNLWDLIQHYLMVKSV